MDDNRSKKCVDDGTLRFIRYKARQVVSSHGFRPDEFEDVQQALILHCLERMVRFDSRRANARTFARLVICQGIANIIESRRAQCRDYRLCQLSLDSSADNADSIGVEPAEALSTGDRGGLLQRPPLHSEHELLLRWDVERAIAALPRDLQQICHALMALDRLTEVALAIHLSRATLHRRICRIRTALAYAGLASYVRVTPARQGAEQDGRSARSAQKLPRRRD